MGMKGNIRGIRNCFRKSGSLFGSELGPVRMRYSCVAWSSCGTPHIESKSCL